MGVVAREQDSNNNLKKKGIRVKVYIQREYISNTKSV